ncbi:unnamed protein product [Rotaria sp. Silwood2]|nr:unnamed protein product [Rotaria sp. Silwood2]
MKILLELLHDHYQFVKLIKQQLYLNENNGFFASSIDRNVIVENRNNDYRTILTGYTEGISTMTLSNDITVLASAQCSTVSH